MFETLLFHISTTNVELVDWRIDGSKTAVRCRRCCVERLRVVFVVDVARGQEDGRALVVCSSLGFKEFRITSWQADGSAVSMFECDLKANANRIELAKNAYKRMRTFRHPYILSWLEGQETEAKLTIVTESVRPLSHVLNEIEEWTDVERNLVSWGLYQVAVIFCF